MTLSDPKHRWLEIATKDLSEESCREIREETEARYSDAVKSHLATGQPGPKAHLLPISDLGDPEKANRRFRRSHLTVKEAKQLSRFLSPPTPASIWLSLSAVILLTALMALMSRRPAALALAALLPILYWAMGLVRDRLRRRLTVRAGIVFVFVAVTATFTLNAMVLPVLTGLSFSTFAPGMIGGSVGFAIYFWGHYRSLWRKVGTRRIAT